MKHATLKLTNRLGLHARPAAQFVQTAAKFSSKVTLTGNNKTVDAKSVLSVMTMGLTGGMEVTLIVEGEDEAACIAALSELIESQFGEE